MKKSSNPFAKGKSIANLLPIGSEAPLFPLLEDNLDKDVLIHFFPNTGTEVCKKELDNINSFVNKYTLTKVKVIAISDTAQSDLDLLKASESYNFDILSDSNLSISTAYKALFREVKSNRSTYLISDGIIVWEDARDNGRNMAAYSNIFRGWRPSNK